MTPQANTIKTPTVAVVAPEAISVNVQQQQQQQRQQATTVNTPNTTNQIANNVQQQKEEQKIKSNNKINKVQEFAEEEEEEEEEQQQHEEEEDEEEDENSRENEQDDQDPLGGVDPQPVVTNYTLTPAQKKASESGLVYKFIIKDGQSILAKVPPKSTQSATTVDPNTPAEDGEEQEENDSNDVVDEDAETAEDAVDNAAIAAEVDENSSSLDKTEKDNDSNSSTEDKLKAEELKKSDDKKSSVEKDKSGKDHRSSKDKERRGSSSSLDKEKDKERESKSSKSSSSSSSSSHRSSSHKSSSSSSKSSSSSSSKSKSSSSSSSSHRSSSDKHRSDKERSSSSKDKDRDRSSSSNSKHRSSSSSKSSSSSSSKDKYRDKERSSSSSSSSSSKSKDKSEHSQSDKVSSSSSNTQEKLAKIAKKSKEETGSSADGGSDSNKPTSITIPSKKASMSIEIRKDTEKAKTVKTYKSQFRSHGLTEEAPPPPSRKGLKKPSSTTHPGTVLPSSLPSSLKRTSPPPRDLPSEKKAKIDINNVTVANEKPGAIKLIPPKKIQTLVETNLFSDALSAATGPKKVTKRKRPNTPAVNGKEHNVPGSPTSPDGPKVMPLKFYQDTLDESKTEDSKSDKENEETNASTKNTSENVSTEDKDLEDDDDIPLKKVKEDIEQKVALEKKENSDSVNLIKDDNEEKSVGEGASSPSRQLGSPKDDDNDVVLITEKKPGPGCGPNGPPGVLMLHRRKGPKKKLTWRPQESLEQIRYFELDENERCNVTKTSFMDMKNMERFSERDAIVMARRGFNQEDNMEPQTHWKPLIEVDDVPPHPEGNQSKQRKIQAEREMTTLRALYFTHALIPDSPAEAEFEPVFNHDVPLIPLEDLTGNPDAVNDFTSMPWPEPKGSPKQGDNAMAGTGGLGSPVNMFNNTPTQMPNVPNMNNKPQGGGGNPFNPFVSNPFVGNQVPNGPNGPAMQNSPQNPWQGPSNGMGGPMGGNGPMMGNPFNGSHGSPIMDMGGPGPMGPGPMMNNVPPQNFINQFSNNFGGPNNNNPFINGPFNNVPNNFGPMGPNGPMMNGMGPGPMGNNCPPQMMNGVGGHNNRNNRGNNGGNWRSGGPGFQDNNGGGGGNWRPAGPGPNNRGGGGGNGNNGVCKAFMRGHCRLGNSCKYIHPNKSKRI
ncbi:phosphatase 1 nuclear targeting subunit isoform 2-T4 [Cochliomyia hominivorax]